MTIIRPETSAPYFMAVDLAQALGKTSPRTRILAIGRNSDKLQLWLKGRKSKCEPRFLKRMAKTPCGPVLNLGPAFDNNFQAVGELAKLICTHVFQLSFEEIGPLMYPPTMPDCRNLAEPEAAGLLAEYRADAWKFKEYCLKTLSRAEFLYRMEHYRPLLADCNLLLVSSKFDLKVYLGFLESLEGTD
jgi:hypothetical protein